MLRAPAEESASALLYVVRVLGLDMDSRTSRRTSSSSARQGTKAVKTPARLAAVRTRHDGGNSRVQTSGFSWECTGR